MIAGYDSGRSTRQEFFIRARNEMQRASRYVKKVQRNALGAPLCFKQDAKHMGNECYKFEGMQYLEVLRS